MHLARRHHSSATEELQVIAPSKLAIEGVSKNFRSASGDVLALDGDARDQLDVSPSPRDGILIISIAAGRLSDSIGPIMPTYDSHYRHSGITYGANEPILADSALVLNGAAVLHGG